jgi:hypothetical protein
VLVTTGKDAIRLRSAGIWVHPVSSSPTFAPPIAGAGHGSSESGEDIQFFTTGLRIEIQDEETVLDWLTGRLNDTAGRPSM